MHTDIYIPFLGIGQCVGAFNHKVCLSHMLCRFHLKHVPEVLRQFPSMGDDILVLDVFNTPRSQH